VCLLIILYCVLTTELVSVS